MSDTDADRSSAAQTVAARELHRFRSIQQLRNHWAREGGPPTYYWYLTFQDHTGLHSLAEHCRRIINLPYYDFTPPAGLHMTLDRIAAQGEIAPDTVQAAASAAAQACSDIPAFEVDIGGLGGTPGAIGFSAFPREPIEHLRNALHTATRSAYPDALVRAADFHPHVTIAYCNADVGAAPAVAALERMSGVDSVPVLISHVTLVLLEQRPRAYAWQEVERIPLRPL